MAARMSLIGVAIDEEASRFKQFARDLLIDRLVFGKQDARASEAGFQGFFGQADRGEAA